MGSGRTGAQGSGGYGASDDTYGSSGRSGGDDSYGSSGRTGAGDDSYGSSGRTGGGLGMLCHTTIPPPIHLASSLPSTNSFPIGQDDTYGSSGTTGGVSSGRDNEYGMGSGRTGAQDAGGYGTGSSNTYGDDDNDNSRSKKNDSTAGKLMEKAGSMFKSSKLEERGAEKRREAGRDDNDY
jgi:hypothetical protein